MKAPLFLMKLAILSELVKPPRSVVIRRLAFVLVFLFPSEDFVQAQVPKIPRDFNKLVDRAQDFWTAMAANQRLKALEFVVPEKKEFLLSSGGMPFVDPQMVGIDFTGDVNRASVRVSVKAISPATPSGRLDWIVTDTWVWLRNNWFLDIQDPKGGMNLFISSRKPSDAPDPVRTEAESQFKILDSSVEVGTITKGDVHRIPVRVEYTGDAGVWIASGLTSELLSLEGISQSVTAKSKEFGLLLNTEAWDGPFTILYPLKIHYKGITIDRSVTVRGSIFVPLSMTQRPSPFLHSPEHDPALLVRNNTAATVTVLSVGSEGVFSVVRFPDRIPAGGEGEIVLRLDLNAKASPNQLIHLNLEQPLQGSRVYDLRLRVRSTP